VIELSVITPTFQRRESVLRLLDALDRQTVGPCAFEVIVADDGSSDGTVNAVSRRSSSFALEVLVLAHGGAAAARNAAIARARGRVLVFFDDDVVPDPDALAVHAALHREPGLVVVGPMLPAVGARRSAWVRWEEEKLERQYDALRRGLYPCTPRQFYTGNASVERERVLRVGGFDERLRRGEDVELAYRLQATDVRFVFAPGARVRHDPTRTYASWRHARYEYGRIDVIMERDKGHQMLSEHFAEYHARHVLSRALARLTVGRRRVRALALAALDAFVTMSHGSRAARLAAPALSAVSNVLYWQGVSDELGGANVLWRAIEVARAGGSGRPGIPRRDVAE